MRTIKIGDRLVGDGQPCFVIAEIGINHNGSVDTAKGLIEAAKNAGCDAVKFQKRSVDLCYTKEELDKPRESPWGNTTRQQKEGLEFSARQYEEIDAHCKAVQIPWFASCWDIPSVDFIWRFKPPCFKIASASLTDRKLIERVAATGKPLLLSTGMSTDEEIRAAYNCIWNKWSNWDDGNPNAVELPAFDSFPLVLMHCTSTYPSKPDELNLECIRTLQSEYPVVVGYSGHEVGLQTTVAAAVLGAAVVERHLTLDRSMYGSDQSASVEPQGFKEMVRDIRACEQARGDGVKRVYDGELPIKAKLRKVETLCGG